MILSFNEIFQVDLFGSWGMDEGWGWGVGCRTPCMFSIVWMLHFLL